MLVNEPEIPRGMWKLARIKEIKRGSDGEARNAIIEMPHGKLLSRPINVLYSLEINDNLDNQPPISEESIQEVG